LEEEEKFEELQSFRRPRRVSSSVVGGGDIGKRFRPVKRFLEFFLRIRVPRDYDAGFIPRRLDMAALLPAGVPHVGDVAAAIAASLHPR